MQKGSNDTTSQFNFDRKLILFAFTLCLFFSENLTRDYLKGLTIKYFLSTSPERCSYFIYTDYLEKGIKLFIVYLSYNCINVFSALGIIFMDVLSGFISGNLKLLYSDERPFMTHPEYPPCLYAPSYGNPSFSAMSLFLVFATFYQAMKQKKCSQKNLNLCVVLWVLVVCYSCYIRMLQNLVYLNQIFLGIGLGYIINYIMFEILLINFFDFSQFKVILDNKSITIISIIMVFILNTFIQFTLSDSFDVNQGENAYSNVISKFYPSKNNTLFLDKVNYILLTRLFEFLGFYLGILFEYSLIFKCNDELFTRYNIKEANQNGQEMFNNTKFDATCFRIIFFCICHYYLSIRVSIKSIDTQSYGGILYSLPIMESTYIGVIVFFIVKYIIKYFGITNERLFGKLSLKERPEIIN